MERVQKLIAQAGITSRRKAEELIKQGKVTINGVKAELGAKATFNDNIVVNGVPLVSREEFEYYILNKPARTITSLSDERGRLTVTDLIDTKTRIFPVGRLDYDTTGTLLLTNDGELAHRLTHPSYEIKRVYRARITTFYPLSRRKAQKKTLTSLTTELYMLMERSQDKKLKELIQKVTLFILSIGGTYHHVKKLFEKVGEEVISLTRIEYAGISHVGKLSKGEYRRLNVKEVRWLKQLTNMI